MFTKQGILSDAIETSEGLKIVYDDVAPYAKENSHPQVISPGLRPHKGLYPGKLHPRSTVVKKYFPDLKRDDLAYPGYSLCLPRFALLDGNYINFPDNASDYGYISDEISGDDRVFSHRYIKQGLRPHVGLHPGYDLFPAGEIDKIVENPELTVLFSQKFTSVGLLITFNLMSGDYCTKIKVKWYSDGSILSDMDFEPNSTRYFCNNYVKSYDKIVITFMETSKPLRPVFITRLDYGIYRDFMRNELTETSCLQEINSISENISINTLSFTIRTKTNIPFDFQKKQKLSVFFNGNLIGNFYLKNGARKNATDYHIESHDAVGVLDGNEFSGGIYSGQTVGMVLEKIFENEDFNYFIEESLINTTLIGYIPYTTKRNALVQIAFAIGAVVDTSNFDGVLIYPQQTEVSGTFVGNTFEGVSLQHKDVVTGIRLTAHTWQKSEETTELYKDILKGTGEIIFSEPYYGLTISGGNIVDSGDNYAVISGNGGEVILTGKKYNRLSSTKIKENPNIVFNKNIKEVSDATLVHSGNVQAVLDRVYAYYQRAENVTGDVLLGNIRLGQVVEINTGYDGLRSGTLESINYSFAGEIKAEVIIHE